MMDFLRDRTDSVDFLRDRTDRMDRTDRTDRQTEKERAAGVFLFYFIFTDSELGQSAAQSLCDGLQLFQLRLLTTPLLTQDLFLHPLVTLSRTHSTPAQDYRTQNSPTIVFLYTGDCLRIPKTEVVEGYFVLIPIL